GPACCRAWADPRSLSLRLVEIGKTARQRNTGADRAPRGTGLSEGRTPWRRKPMRKTLSLLVLAAVLAPPAHAKVTRYLTGNAADVVVPLFGPAHDFGGGGTDVDAALQWIIDQVRGCTGAACATKIDVVILRSSGSNGYNDYIYAMNGVDSVETLVITSA